MVSADVKKRFGNACCDITVSDFIDSSGRDLFCKLCLFTRNILCNICHLHSKSAITFDHNHLYELLKFFSNLHSIPLLKQFFSPYIWFYAHLIVFLFTSLCRLFLRCCRCIVVHLRCLLCYCKVGEHFHSIATSHMHHHHCTNSLNFIIAKTPATTLQHLRNCTMYTQYSYSIPSAHHQWHHGGDFVINTVITRSECVNSFLTTHQHAEGGSVPQKVATYTDNWAWIVNNKR